MAFIDEKGNWVGPGTDPRQVGQTNLAPAAFNPQQIPGVSIPAGYTPTDWTNLIKGNSGYMAWGLNAAQRADIAAASRRAALRSLAVRYGGLPTSFKDVYGDLSPEDLAQAQANPLSEFRRLEKGYADTTLQEKRQLAARHALQSGDFGHAMGQLDYQHSSDLYDLTQQQMDAAQRAVNEYAGTLSGLSQEQIDAIRQAASDVYGQGYRLGSPGFGGGTGGTFDGFEMPFPVQGYSDEEVVNAAKAYATAHGYIPHMLMQEGTITTQGGVPGVMIKYIDAKGLSTTEWTPLPTHAPAVTPETAPIPTPTPIAPSVRPYLTESDPYKYAIGGGAKVA